jgi:hypothetical protein
MCKASQQWLLYNKERKGERPSNTQPANENSDTLRDLRQSHAQNCYPLLFWTDQWDHSHRDNWMIQELFPWQRQLWAFEGPARGKQLAELLLPYPYVFPQNQQGIKFHFHIFVSHVYREEKFQRSIVILSELKREISAHLGKMWMV